MTHRPFSISAVSTYHATFEEDVAAYRAAGCEGIGLWEYKIPSGQDERLRSTLDESRLRATICVPDVASFMPDGWFRLPIDTGERVDAIRASIRRFSAFDPATVLLMSGDPAGRAEDEARRLVIDGLRAAAEVAADLGLTIGFEPLRQASGSLVWTLPDALALLDEVGRDEVGIVVDTWHLWGSDRFLDHLRSDAGRILGVQVCDVRAETRSWCDRVLPGDGIIDWPAVLEALDAGGYRGWFDLEIFSDDGSFSEAYPDSLWAWPADRLALTARERFEALAHPAPA
jgi:sugar phosphate isomerase/epimerase